MSDQSFAAEQLLELLLQLKKTTPASARLILNGQPQIAYALMTLMVTMNAVNFDVFQKILAEYGSKSAPATQVPAPNAPPNSALPPTSQVPTPVPALPAHLHPQSQPYRTGTPPSQSYPYPNGSGPSQPQPTFAPPPPFTSGQSSNYGYSQPQPQTSYSYPGYGTPAPVPTPPNPSIIPDTLAAIPDEQKALIMRVITMTPEQINSLPQAERQTYIQLRATLGVPT